MNLEGKRVLITGGAKRIGAALVQAFAERGAEVIIHCFQSTDEAAALARSVPRTRVVSADLRDPDCSEKVFAAAGTVDVLVNNASIYNTVKLAPTDEPMLEEFFRVNFLSPLELMRNFARTGREGAIVNILDQEVLSGRPALFGAYSLSRRALADATLECAVEFAPRIRVNAVAPGPVLPPVGMPESRMEKTLQSVPLRRPVTLDDLCSAVIFLAENDSITGAILPVDCGQRLN